MELRKNIFYIVIVVIIVVMFLVVVLLSDEDNTLANKNNGAYNDKFVKEVDRFVDGKSEIINKNVAKRILYCYRVMFLASNDLFKNIIVFEQSNFKDTEKIVPIYISETEYKMIIEPFNHIRSYIKSHFNGLSKEVNYYYELSKYQFDSLFRNYDMKQLLGYFPSIAMEKNEKFIDDILSKSGSYLTKDHQKLISEKNIKMNDTNRQFSALELVSYFLISFSIGNRQ